MKITTANIKSPKYEEQHELYVGTHIGSFKKLDLTSENPHKEVNIQKVSELTKTSRVTCLEWGNDEQTEVLIGRANNFVKIYDILSNVFTSNIKMAFGPVVGLCRYEGTIIGGLENGQIQIYNDVPVSTVIKTGSNMSHMRQCQYEKKLVATGGKERENNLKVWDLETKKSIFTSKNVKPDMLQMEVPVWDSDVGFLDQYNLITCSRHGYVRYYDVRTHRRPVLQYTSKEQVSFPCLAIHDKLVYVGNTVGVMKAFDTRSLKFPIHTYKGATGSITDIGVDPTGKYLFSASLDRFVRVHSTQNNNISYQCYIKTKATEILLRTKMNENSKIELPNTCTGKVDELNIANNVESDEEYEEIFKNMESVEESDSKGSLTKRKRKKNISMKNVKRRNK